MNSSERRAEKDIQENPKANWIITASSLKTIIALAMFAPLVCFAVAFWPPALPSNISRLFLFSFKQAALSALLALLAGLAPAVCASRSGRLGHLCASSSFIPFFFPSAIAATAFTAFYAQIFSSTGLELRGTLAGLLIAHVFYESPIFVKYLSAALKQIPIELRDLMKLDGLPWHKQFFIYFVLIKQQLFSAFFLAFFYAFSSFALVLSLGLGRMNTLETALASALFREADFNQALGLGLTQALFFLLFYFISPKKATAELQQSLPNKKQAPLAVQAGALLYLLGIFIVIGSLLARLDNRAWQIFTPAFNARFKIWQAMGNSALIALAASAVAVSAVLWAANQKASKIFMAPLFFSSALWAAALYFFSLVSRFPESLSAAYGLFLSALPIAYNFLKPAFSSFPKSLLEAGRCDGASEQHIFWSIQWPLLRCTAGAVFLQCFALCYGEFTFAYFLSSEQFPLAQAVSYKLLNRRLLPQAQAYSFLNLAAISLVFWIGEKLYKQPIAKSASQNLP